MSDLSSSEKVLFERLFGMRSGYVLDFTNATFAEFFREHGIDIYSERYAFNGNSKAKRLRAFWELEPNDLVADVLSAMLDYWTRVVPTPTDEQLALGEKCKQVIHRLRTSGLTHPSLDNVKGLAAVFNAQYLKNQIQRMDQAVDSDPELAIGTAKELVETCCRTILREQSKLVDRSCDIPQLVKAVLKELPLLPENVPEFGKGTEIIKRLTSNLASVLQGLAELRNLYGTGHGKEAETQSITPRHAKLAVGIAATLATFLFETHKEMGR